MPQSKTKTRPTVFVTTCGTSLLTNKFQGADPPSIINQYTNCKDVAAIPDATHREVISKHVDARKQMLLQADVETAKKLSAELNGCLSFSEKEYGNAGYFQPEDYHLLLHTDTWLGKEVASILVEKLQLFDTKVSLESIQDLNTANIHDFHYGLGNLIEWVAQTVPSYREKYRVIFNLVGGFKSVQGFMQTLGMFYADEILYIFETGNALLRVPRIPVDINKAAIEQVREHLNILRSLSVLGKTTSPFPQTLPETFLYRLESEYELSPWGNIVWQQAKPELYREKLWDSYSNRVRFSDVFRKQASGLSQDRLMQLNSG